MFSVWLADSWAALIPLVEVVFSAAPHLTQQAVSSAICQEVNPQSLTSEGSSPCIRVCVVQWWCALFTRTNTRPLFPWDSSFHYGNQTLSYPTWPIDHSRQQNPAETTWFHFKWTRASIFACIFYYYFLLKLSSTHRVIPVCSEQQGWTSYTRSCFFFFFLTQKMCTFFGISVNQRMLSFMRNGMWVFQEHLQLPHEME